MTEEQFQGFLERSIARRAGKWVERGIWSEAKALDACRELYTKRLPQGRSTLHHHFLNIRERDGGARVGEAWYVAEELGGRLQFWVEWLWIDP